MRKDGTLYTLI